ncbi:MTH865 family protein [Halohasta salina]|uniref:MTH865 family protein n=1 Tax=Halohasta salina TaxID=2961621 RepID=UPI0020A358F9|nr:MTH865 family protein [Halohasta salina]
MPTSDADNGPADPAAIESALRRQFTETFEQAEYPLSDPFSLIPLLPEGAATEFRAGPVVVPAIDLGLRYGDYQQYPYEEVDALVDDLIAGLKAEDELPTAPGRESGSDPVDSPEGNPKP